MNRNQILGLAFLVATVIHTPAGWAYVNGVGKAAWARMSAAERNAYERGGMKAVERLRREGGLKDSEGAGSATSKLPGREEERETARYEALGRLAAGTGTLADRELLARWKNDQKLSTSAYLSVTPPTSVPPEKVLGMVLALQSEDARVRHRAAYDLRLTGEAGKEAVPLLVKALDDSDADVRQVAAGTLGEMGTGSREIVRALAICLADSKPQVRRCAAESLRKLLP
jgi:HEAT repeats